MTDFSVDDITHKGVRRLLQITIGDQVLRVTVHHPTDNGSMMSITMGGHSYVCQLPLIYLTPGGWVGYTDAKALEGNATSKADADGVKS